MFALTQGSTWHMVPKASSKLGALHSGLSCCSSLQVITLRITHPRHANTENLPPNLDYPESVSSLTPTGLLFAVLGWLQRGQNRAVPGWGRAGREGWAWLGQFGHWALPLGCCSDLGTRGSSWFWSGGSDQEAATASSADLLWVFYS